MALRSSAQTPSATSGPGRAPLSDGRIRHRRRPARARRADRAAGELQRRASTLFPDRPPAPPGTGTGAGPPGAVPAPRERAQPPEAAWPGEPAEGDGGPGPTPAPSPGSAGPVPETEAGRTLRPAAVGPSAKDAEPDGPGRGGGPPSGGRGHGWRERATLALRERLPLWAQTRCALERRSVAALALVLLVAAGLAAQHFWSGRTRTVSAPEIVRATGTYEAAGTMGSAAPARPPDTPTAAAQPGARPGALPVAGILVDVVGKVREPGVHQLPVGSRVADALRAAGGVRPGTRVDGLNRARFLVDGEQLHVGGPPAAGPDGPAGGPAAGAAAGAGTGAAAALAIPAVPVSLNTATAEQLDGLPGVGPVLAQHIIDYRTRRGGFRTVDELREVDGIGERRFADLRNLVRP